MARTVNKEENAAKRNEILDSAQRLVLSKGYERMTIQDILAELTMSSGAFYHYFATKPMVLEALIERLQQEGEQPLLLIIHDPDLSALEKLQRFFATFDRLRMMHKATVIDMLHVWYTDDNAIVRQKVDAATLERRVPLLTEVVYQGVQEGIFKTAYPDQVAEIILSLFSSMGNTHAKLLLSLKQESEEHRCIEAIVTTHAAYMDAVEHVLGAPANALYRTDTSTVKRWVDAMQGDS